MAHAPTPPNSITKRMMEVERQLHQLQRATQMHRRETLNTHHDFHLAVTVETADYPSKTGGTGNTALRPKFPIKFIDESFTNTPGWQAPTTQDRNDPGTQYDVTAIGTTAGWVKPGTFVLAYFQRPPKSMDDGSDNVGEWFLLNTEPSGKIGFVQLSDRTRETDAGGLRFGRATVRIQAIVGTVPHAVGDTVEVRFFDSRWLESVTGCEGTAEWYENDALYIVDECQGLVQGFWARTLDHRTAGAPEEDIRVEIVKNIGHAQDDFPREDWNPAGQQGSCGGSAVWQFNNGTWQSIVPCSGNCQSQQNPNDMQWAPPPSPGQIFTSPCVGAGGQQAEIKVRFLADTFPRMLEGAMVYVVLDNDIANTTDNSTMRYYVLYSQEMADEISGILTAAVCGEDFAVSGVQVDSDWPHNQMPPTPLTIKNGTGYFRHAGMPGDRWSAEWSRAEQAYVCDDITKVQVSVSSVTDVTNQQTGCRTISWSNQNIWVERCANAAAGGELSFKTGLVHRFKDYVLDEGEAQSGSLTTCSPTLNLRFYEETALLICASDSTLRSYPLPIAAKEVVIDFDADGCPIWSTQTIFVLGVCDNVVVHEADCDECPEGSG